ncbi:MAG: hypothetical protein GAK45_00895 [Pseudomonas citronellolis]|nr:MAG: hypothetical protein GAK45_00895 [Pseudomonas citronellolis]
MIEQAAHLLREVDESHWAAWLEWDAERLRDSDFQGVEHFLRAFGGMGSINDLVIHPLNGYRLTPAEAADVNVRLVDLLGRGWGLARAIGRNLEC